jgi:hypothetical protein
MVEIADEEFTMIKSFLVDDMGNNVDWEQAPDDFKNAYTNVLQIVNAYGQEQEQASTATVDQGVAAPA